MEPKWGPPGSCQAHVGPMLAPRTLLSGSVPELHQTMAADVLGPDSIQRCRLTSIGNPIVEIRLSDDPLISIMGIPILVRWRLYIESWLWFLASSGQSSSTVWTMQDNSVIVFHEDFNYLRCVSDMDVSYMHIYLYDSYDNLICHGLNHAFDSNNFMISINVIFSSYLWYHVKKLLVLLENINHKIFRYFKAVIIQYIVKKYNSVFRAYYTIWSTGIGSLNYYSSCCMQSS